MEYLKVKVDTESYNRLKDEAAKRQVSVEDLAGALLSTVVHSQGPEAAEYRAMARRHLKHYESVFRRLAE